MTKQQTTKCPYIADGVFRSLQIHCEKILSQVLGGDRSYRPALDPPLSGFTIISKLLSECWLVGLLQLSYDPWHKPLVAPLGIINFYPSLNMALKSLFCNKKLFSYYIMHPGMRHDRKTCLWHSPYEPTCACNVDKMLNSS